MQMGQRHLSWYGDVGLRFEVDIWVGMHVGQHHLGWSSGVELRSWSMLSQDLSSSILPNINFDELIYLI